jgi:hypothetical protein
MGVRGMPMMSMNTEMSGRSCSIACPVFFSRDPPAIEEPPQSADPDKHPPFGKA